jgi:hypothetical protein
MPKVQCVGLIVFFLSLKVFEYFSKGGLHVEVGSLNNRIILLGFYDGKCSKYYFSLLHFSTNDFLAD